MTRAEESVNMNKTHIIVIHLQIGLENALFVVINGKMVNELSTKEVVNEKKIKLVSEINLSLT